MISVEEAIQPYIDRYKDLSKEELLNIGSNACGCMGPSEPHIPLCPCKLRAKAREVLLDIWYENN